MANLSTPVSIYPNSSWYLQQRNFYWFNTGSGSPSYIHFKTNLYNNIDVMYMIEAVGYNYGAASPVRCAWGFYYYLGGVSHVGLQNEYSGMSADGVYTSSDGYLCFRAYAGTHYYNGFILNAYATRTDTTHYAVSITAVNQNSTSGNYY